MIRLVVSGCCGRMGRRVIALAGGDEEFQVVGAIEARAHPDKGKKLNQVLQTEIGDLDVKVNDEPDIIRTADILVEFSTPSATVGHLPFVVKYKRAMVIGTTGLDAQQIEKVKEVSRAVPIVFSPNMSVGVNLVFRLVKETTQKLKPDYKVDIVEAHHIHKKDAPSGTAKRLAELIKQTQGWENKKIDIDSIREGEIVGEHQVRFNGPRETIIIKHSAKTRDIFAQGALEAAKFVVRQKPGLYDMQDVIGD